MAIRKPIVAGQFYSGTREELERELNACFSHDKGPGDTPGKRDKPTIKALILPHAGYNYSGPCSAWGYKEVGESKLPDTFVMLGVDHSGYGKTAISTDTWETPLGMLRIDNELAKALEDKGIPIDPEAHANEHSIEVQLPFLQLVNREEMEMIRILPITISTDKEIKQLGLDIIETLMDLDRKVTFIVSSDLTHYGRNYRYLPFTSEVQKRLYELDEGALKKIKSLDAEGFMDYVEETMATICGQLPIYLLLSMLKKTKGEVLQYYHSGDLSGDFKNSVGYATVMFR